MKSTLFFAALFAAFAHTPNLQALPLVKIQTVTVGDTGNAADPLTGFGAVTNVFVIGKYEVTVAQYTAFLNSVARTNTNSYIVNLWNADMTNDLKSAGISRSGSGTTGDPYTYSVIGPSGTMPAGASSPGNRPVAYVSWFDAARFCNWLHNGATNGASTETGAYALNGATVGEGFTRNAGATWWIPSEDEWYKAAYYKSGGTNEGYWLYPTQSDIAPGNSIGGATNQANYYAGAYAVTQSTSFDPGQNYLNDCGAFSISASRYGTFDQGGNVWEWNDSVSGPYRGLRGSSWGESDTRFLRASGSSRSIPTLEVNEVGFRVAGLPGNIVDETPSKPTLSPVVSNGITTLTWDASITGPVNVEHSADLSGWTTISTSNSAGIFQHTFGNAMKGFYQLRLTPTAPPPVNMALIPAGSFSMGNALSASGDGNADELPVHTVNVSAFYMDQYEVTKALWDEVANWAATNGYDISAASASGKSANHPVHSVTWFSMVKWSNARSEREGLSPCYTVVGGVMKTGTSAPDCNFAASGYRLPTEAEWEKAARGGLSGKRFPWGNTITHSYANYQSYAGYSYDVSPTRGFHPIYTTGSWGFTFSSPVGSFAPNAYGLYDMAGNMLEWCWDWFSSDYYASSQSSDPRGPTSGSSKVYRGGSWDSDPNITRTAYRGSNVGPDFSNGLLGFRCVRSSAP